MTNPLPDDDHLIDNAACASQLKALVDEIDTRQAIKDNVCTPLRAEVERVAKQRDELAAIAIRYVPKDLVEELGARLRAEQPKPEPDPWRLDYGGPTKKQPKPEGGS